MEGDPLSSSSSSHTQLYTPQHHFEFSSIDPLNWAPLMMAQLATEVRPVTGADGSRTITIRTQPSTDSDEPDAGSLRLRGGPRPTRHRVAWDDDVVDNEGCGRKKSKICCIYHKPKRFDESSDEDSSSSSSESDSDSSCDHDHDHNHNHHHNRRHSHSRRRPGGDGPVGMARNEGSGGVVHELEDESEYKNAYELAPGHKKGKGKKS